MVLTVTEDTPADMLAGSMELLVQLPRDHLANSSTIVRDHQRVTVPRSTPMMDLLVQIATAHKLAASNYTLQAIGERGLVLPHQPNTPIGALDALQVKLLPKQGTIVPRKIRQANQPFETTFRLQVHLPRNQLYVSRVSPKMNLGEILEEVCREKNLDKTRYELRHPANLEETLDLSLSLQDYHLQEVTLYAKQGRSLGSALSSQDIMALQRQEDRRRQQAKQSVFGFIFKKSKESSLSTDSLGGRSVSPARSDETGRSASPLAPAPARPQRKRRPAPKPPVLENQENGGGCSEATDKMVISHSRNSSDSSGYHEASVLSDNADSSTRAPETLPRRSRAAGIAESSRKLAQSSQASKSLSNLAAAAAAAADGLTHGVSNTSLSSTGLRKKRAAPPPPKARPLSSAISTQGLERIVDSEESLTSDMDLSKPPSDIGASSKANSDIDVRSKVNSDIVVDSRNLKSVSDIDSKSNSDVRALSVIDFDLPKVKSEVTSKVKPEVEPTDVCLTKSNLEVVPPVEDALIVEHVRVEKKGGEGALSETDILLQKVSDTLSGSLQLSSHSLSLPASRTPSSSINAADVQSDQIAINTTESILSKTTEVLSETPESIKKMEESAVRTDRSKDEQNQVSSDATDLGRSAPIVIHYRRDNTLDCTLVNGDDLSIVDWEYQLPAPPSAFRDTDSPAFDGYDTITLQSVEALKDPVARNVDSHNANTFVSSENVDLPLKESSNETILRETDSNLKQRTKLEAEAEVEITPLVTKEKRLNSKQTSNENHRGEVNLELKKEIITELENRLENGRLSQSSSKVSESDSRRIPANSSTPGVAPVDNTLSNFTITTYSSQKSLNIFGEVEYEQQNVPVSKKSDDRTIKNFATLTRNNNTLKSSNDSTDARKNSSNILSLDLTPMEMSKLNAQHNLSDDTEFRKPVPKTYKQHELVSRHQSFNSDNIKSNNVHRSMSYVSPINNLRYKEMNDENERIKSVALQFENDECGVKKSISSNNLSQEMLRNNEKFSQWRDNILKRQEEPSKEKQLQSLQVLKSILPQLKNNQQTEENVSKQCNGILSDKKKSKILSRERTIESKAVPTMTEPQARTETGPPKLKSEELNKKRHSYAGPPAINLGSWSERPCINVQIKMDTDYKFGENNASGAKTVVNLNGLRDETDIVQYNNDAVNMLPKRIVKNGFTENDAKPEAKQSEKKESHEFSKKLITHTSSEFKRPVSNKVGFAETKLGSRNEENLIVAGAELKKTSTDRNESLKERDDEIDTKPVNFRELTKTFGQEVCFRAKPKHIIQNRHSDYYGTKPNVIQHFTKSDINQNGCADSNKALKPTESALNYHVTSNGVQSDVQNVPIKKYTSVVGIRSQNPHFGIQNGNYLKNNSSSIKITGPMPVVKGFKIQTAQIEPKIISIPAKQNGISMVDCSKKSTQTPKPPTMPVITGVTFKSANAKPKSVYLDSRDQLLESIRSFGGRDKLRCVTGRY